MFRFIAAIFLLLCWIYPKAQTFQWAKKAGGTGYDVGMAVALTSGNNVYVTGYIGAASAFDGEIIGTNGGTDGFLAKYSESGVIQWARNVGGSGDGVSSDVVSDAGGNIIIIGYFQGQAVFGSYTLTSAGGKDVFVAKYDQSWQWDFGDGGNANVQNPVHTYTSTGNYNVQVIVTQDGCTDTAYYSLLIHDDVGVDESTTDSFEFLYPNIPNPFNRTTIIPYNAPIGKTSKLEIRNMAGVLIYQRMLEAGKNRVEVSLENMANGNYFYSMVVEGEVKETRKMTLIK